MRVALSADHAGFEMKEDLARILAGQGHQVLDLGTHSTVPVDYPDCARAAAAALHDGRAERGILVCGGGAGASVSAAWAATWPAASREAGMRSWRGTAALKRSPRSPPRASRGRPPSMISSPVFPRRVSSG